MMTDTIPVRAWQHGAVLRHLAALAESFRWALEVKRLCNRSEAHGRQLDGDTLHEIMREADRRQAGH